MSEPIDLDALTIVGVRIVDSGGGEVRGLVARDTESYPTGDVDIVPRGTTAALIARCRELEAELAHYTGADLRRDDR